MTRAATTLLYLACLLLLAPILVVVIVSFSGDAFLAFPPTTLSLRWYQVFLGDPNWLAALGNSIAVAAMSSVLATSTGVIAAYAFVKGGRTRRAVLTAIGLMPLIVPSIVTAIAVYFLSVRLGLVGNRVWLAATHAVVALPVVLIISQTALQAIDPGLERAAMIHGCTRWGVFRRVVLPIAAPGIASAALFAFLASFDELVIALFVSGVRSQTLPVRIWNSLTLELSPTIAAVSTFLIVVTLTTLLVNLGVRELLSRRTRISPAGQ